MQLNFNEVVNLPSQTGPPLVETACRDIIKSFRSCLSDAVQMASPLLDSTTSLQRIETFSSFAQDDSRAERAAFLLPSSAGSKGPRELQKLFHRLPESWNQSFSGWIASPIQSTNSSSALLNPRINNPNHLPSTTLYAQALSHPVRRFPQP